MELPKFTLWGVVKALATLAIVFVFCVKAYQTPVQLTIDFPTLLSLLLAIFSIALSALFYFKATETSNTFYDNTYKFTRDIAQLLSKIESGFGERLRHLDEGYASMRTYLETKSSVHDGASPDITKQQIKDEKDEVVRVTEQRNHILRDLLNRSKLQEAEKKEFENQLAQKQGELENIQKTVARLERQLFMERLRARRKSLGGGSGMDRFTKSQVIEKIGTNHVLRAGVSTVQHLFNELADNLPQGYLEDMEKNGYYDQGLTHDGVRYLVSLAKAADA